MPTTLPSGQTSTLNHSAPWLPHATHTIFQKEKLARIDELIDSMIDQLRDGDGGFTLHTGFDKECGLKGSKLSGG